MPQSRTCTYCTNDFPFSAGQCPHCGQPGLFPNVYAAEEPDERAALDRRYKSAQTDSMKRGATASLNDFETAAASSKAVIARSIIELQRIAMSDNELYATYYQLIGGGVKIPEGDNWDILRAVADSALFPNYKEHIRFAALSLDGMGLFH